MNASTLVLSDESRKLICDLVDNQCPLDRSEDPKVVVLTYCAVFLPWSFLALFDMINERWKSLRLLFAEGIFQIVIAVPSIVCTVHYIELQKAGRDYKEMSAAIVALCLSVYHFCRTLWGLWQAYWYWRWVKDSLVHLDQHGYRLEDIEEEMECFRNETRSIEECLAFENESFDQRLNNLSLGMRVNSSIIDNEFFESAIPFELNISKLLRVEKLFSSKVHWFTPRHFENASIRYMIPFLAQFGRKWVKDCSAAKEYAEENKFGSKSSFWETSVSKYAEMLTTGTSCKSDEERMDANWSNTWLPIVMYMEGSLYPSYKVEKNAPMPFGSEDPFPGFGAYKYDSKIKRLIENLPENLFSGSMFSKILGRSDYGKVIEGISEFHLVTFLRFLRSKAVCRIAVDVSEEALEETEASSEEVAETGIPIDPDGESSHETQQQNLDTSSTNLAESSRRDISFRNWFYQRAVHEKLCGDESNTSTQNPGVEWLRKWSEGRITEFTIHLENFFSVSTAPTREGVRRESPSNKKRERYYKELCNRSIRKVEPDEKVIPRCEAQRFYWDLWNLPQCVPPALADGERGGIKFIGQVMETVRVSLAKWTENQATNVMDASKWSPEIERGAAQVEFHPSFEFIRMLSDYHPNRSPRTVLAERMIWECQNHALESIEGDMCFGPSNVKLMLLCMLGFPCLRLRENDRLQHDLYVAPLILATPMEVHITFKRDEERNDIKKLEMGIVPSPEASESASMRFDWAHWIHKFEACMKVLNYEYIDGDLVADGNPNGNENEVGSLTEEGTTSIGLNVSSANGERDSSADRILGGPEGRSDMNNIRADDVGADCSSGCSCGCKYRLNRRAERVTIADRFGTEKYLLKWEGWRPQHAFEQERFPMLHDFNAVVETNGRNDELNGCEQNGSDLAGDVVSRADASPDADDQV